MTNEEHPVAGFFREIEHMRYPPGVTRTRDLVPGAEFFPGGCGSWTAERGKSWPALPVGGVLVLGHNLDSVETYEGNVANGGPRPGPTWRNLAALLEEAGISKSDCFLTNFFMGCGPNQTGAFPGARDPEFVAACAAFLRTTIRAMRPKLLLVLGRSTWRHLGAVAPELAVWGGVPTFAELDRADRAVVPLAMDDVPPFAAVTVIHPSGAHMGGNRRKRSYGGLTGLEAEALSLRHALAHARPA